MTGKPKVKVRKVTFSFRTRPRYNWKIRQEVSRFPDWKSKGQMAYTVNFDPAVLINAISRPSPPRRSSLSFSRVLSSREKQAGGSKARPPHGAGANLVCSLLSFYCLPESEESSRSRRERESDRIVFPFCSAITLISAFPKSPS